MKQAVCYYLCIASSALSALVGACVLTMEWGMGSLGLGLGLSFVAVLVAALAYGNAAPLNKARCQLWFLSAVVALGCYFVLFVLCDLVRLPVTFEAGEDAVVRMSAMTIVCLAFACVSLAWMAFLTVRVVLLATGRFATDAERRAAREVENAAPREVQPRAMDTEAVVQQAEQELNSTRLTVEEDLERPLVTPEKAREIAAARAKQAPAPIVTATVDVEPEEVRIPEEIPVVRSEPAPVPVLADAESLLMQDEVEPDQDIRSETATHHIRQPLQERGNDLYNDFSYSNDDGDQD